MLVAIVASIVFRALHVQLGPGAGSELLQAIARRIALCLRSADAVAQLGGGEFGLLLTGIQDTDGAVEVLDKIVRALVSPLHLRGQTHCLSVSIGGCRCGGRATGAHPLLLAEMAMLRARARGGNGFHLSGRDDIALIAGAGGYIPAAGAPDGSMPGTSHDARAHSLQEGSGR